MERDRGTVRLCRMEFEGASASACFMLRGSGAQALTGYHLGPQKSLAALEEIFSAGGRRDSTSRVTVLLLDEMDLLLTRTQAVRFSSTRQKPALLIHSIQGLAPEVSGVFRG